MTTMETITLLASISSLVLAVMAIWLSIVFFKMSSQLSTNTTEAAKGIGTSVERLEKLFDKLYADTFSMMRDTVDDMRKHIWPESTDESSKLAEEAAKRAEAEIENLKKTFSKELEGILHRQSTADAQFRDMTKLLDRVIVKSRSVEVEAREQTLRTAILGAIRDIRKTGKKVTADLLVTRLANEAPVRKIVSEIEKMRDEKILELSQDALGPETTIRIVAS